jgi:hypothetical protein
MGLEQRIVRMITFKSSYQ